MSGKLDLPNVALCSVDTVNPRFALKAMEHCINQCDFADAVLLTDVQIDAPFRVEKIRKILDHDDYSGFVTQQLYRFTDADFILIVQWDGYIIDTQCWREDFLEYDYIGARWLPAGGDMSVGNGGFSLRSRRLMEILAFPAVPPRKHEPEDVYICRTLRPQLESSYKMRFASDEIADAFSVELIRPERPSFGFHGLYNMWRYINDREMRDMIIHISDSVVLSVNYVLLMMSYAHQRKFYMLSFLCRRMRMVLKRDLLDHFNRTLGNREEARYLARLCRNAGCS